MRAIVTGMIATYPVGGVAWDYGQYALGLERLGWEVYYLEDTGAETYDPVKGEYGSDCSYGVQFLQQSLDRLSPTLGERWHFRAADGSTHGLDAENIHRVVAEADLFLNVSGSALLRDEYMSNACKVLIDSDPGWNHFVNYPRWDANPGWQGSHGYRAHDFFFTYAECMGQPGCVLPDLGIDWHATRPLVVMDCWQPQPPGRIWTTVLTWNNFRQPVEYRGQLYGTKELEFPKVEDLPRRVSHVPLELAVGGSGPPIDRWRGLGWQVVDSHRVSATLDEYRDYIQHSRAEFSVAKNLYTATRSGWFSCRSVCYLAASRPCVLQDTGFSDFIPTGRGLFAFTSLEEAAEAVREVERDYAKHQQEALAIAREYFESSRVLKGLLRGIGLG
jgi:hypothetical protein